MQATLTGAAWSLRPTITALAVTMVFASLATAASLAMVAGPPTCFVVTGSGKNIDYTLQCHLRAANITVEDSNPKGEFVKIICKTGNFNCEDLPLFDELSNGTLQTMTLENCQLPGKGVACTLRQFGFGSVTHLKLLGVPGGALSTLGPEHLATLPLEALTIQGDPYAESLPRTASLPLVALAATPQLINLTIASTPLTLSSDYFAGTPLVSSALKNLKRLELLECGLTELPAHAFRKFPFLRRLVFNYNNIMRVNGAAFEGLSVLHELLLIDSITGALPDFVFTSVPDLRLLKLISNSIPELQSTLFQGLKRLRHVEVLRNEGLVVKARALADLPDLTFVLMENCELRDLPGDVLHGSAALRHLSFAKNKLTSLPPDLLRYQINLETLNLNSNFLTKLSEVFSGLSKLSAVSVSNNKLGGTKEATAAGDGRGSPFSQLVKLQRLDLSYNNFSAIFEDWRISMTSLQLLNLSYNAFDHLTIRELGFIQVNITVDLQHNNITEISTNYSTVNLSKTSGVRVLSACSLDLSSNRLDVIPRYLLTDTEPSLYIAGNPLACDCTHLEDVKALTQRKHLIKDYSYLNCSNGDLLASKDLNALCDSWFIIIVSGTLVMFVAIVTLVSIVAFLCRRGARLDVKTDLDEDKPYDIFISFSHLDHWFVVDNLVKQLESKPRPYKLCLHYRDWIGGEWVPTQIVKSVRDSRRTIIVLSENYLESRWSLMEFRAALECAMRDGRVRLVVVMLRDVTRDPRLGEDMRAYLSIHNYLMWGEDDFWLRLHNSLSRPAPHTLRATLAHKLANSRLTASWLAPRAVPTPAPALSPAPAL